MEHAVLLVDDEPNVLAGLQRALRKEPYNIFCATSAKDGWIILQGRDIDVVISDQDMPGVSGTEFLAKVRQSFPETVRFILTGQATLDVAIQAINEGAISRFFTKPCNPVDLTVTIRQALQQKDLMTEARRLMQVVKRQTVTLESLERQYPGITTVQRDRNGAVIMEPDDMSVDELLQQLRREAAKAETSLHDAEVGDSD